MIEQSGQLMRTSDGRAWVRLGGQVGCPACDAGHGCGAGLFGRLLRRRQVEIELDNPIGAQAGQAVRVGLPETAFLALVWNAWGLPLLAGLAGSLICHQILVPMAVGHALRDAATLAAGIAAAVLAWRWCQRLTVRRLKSQPVELLAIVTGQTACAGRPPRDA